MQWRKCIVTIHKCTASVDWITVLVLPIHIFGKTTIETSKIHNLFIQYSNNKYFSALRSFENGDMTHKN
jgi:hypothetical protein